MFSTDPIAIERARLTQQSASGARWFYWIAALSLITSIAMLTGAHFRFLAGLGITQIVDGVVIALTQNGNDAAKIMGFVVDLTIAGVFALFGFLSLKRLSWAFLLGTVLYGLDSLILLIGQDWIAVAFHGFVVYCLVKGFSACTAVDRLEKEVSFNSPPPPDTSYAYKPEPGGPA